MRTTYRFLVGLALCMLIAASALLVFQATRPPSRPSLAELEQVGRPHIRASHSPKNKEDAIGRGEFELLRLRDPRTGRIPTNMRARELAFAKNLPRVEEFGLGKTWAETWTLRGPMNIGGRTRALAIDLGYNGTTNRRILAGGISGGVYLSEDGGASWQLTTSLSDIASVTCIAQDPRNPLVWYHGTGEFLGNSASGVSANFFGQGIFKSEDGGRSWRQLPATAERLAGGPAHPHVFDSFFDIVWNIVVHPQTSHVFAATYGAIHRSMDGGNTWQMLLGGRENSFNAITDVAIGADGYVYAALSRNGANLQEYGVFRSTDGGNTWANITPPALAQDPYRMVLAPAPSSASTVYLLVQTNQQGATAQDHQFFRFDGNAWTDLSANIPNEQGAEGNASFSSQGGYDLMAKVKPDDPQTVWIGGTNLYRSRDGGRTFTRVGGYARPQDYLGYENHHADQHSMAFFSNDPNAAITGHDGGLSYSPNILETPQKWTLLNNGYITSQFYTVALDPQAGSETIMGGLQDNGSWVTEQADGTKPWIELFSGDGAYAAMAPGGFPFYVSAQNGNIWRGSIENNQIAYSTVVPAGAQNFQFITPYELDPNDARVMYLAAGNTVWRNSNLDAIPTSNYEPTTINWTQLTGSAVGTVNTHQVTTLAVSKSPAGRLFFGTTDYQNETKLIRVDNPAANGPGTDITPNGVIPGSFPSSIALNPDNANEIVATFSNYNVPSVWYSTDGGASWTNVDGNLGGEDGPSVRWAAIVPTSGGIRYFLATSTGVYSTSSITGTNTTWLQEGADTIGNVVASMIRARPADGLVVVGTHGRGVYSARLSPGGGGAAVAATSVQQLDLQARPGETGSVTFELYNTGTAALTYQATPQYHGTAAPRIGELANFMIGSTARRTLGTGAPGNVPKTVPATFAGNVAGPAAGNDVLVLDDGNNTADDFLGYGDGSYISWANRFDLTSNFTLERMQFFMRGNFTGQMTSVMVAVYDAQLNTIASGTLMLNLSQEGAWYEVSVGDPIAFTSGQTFYLEAAVWGIYYPAGTDTKASVPGKSIYCDLVSCYSLGTVQGFSNGVFLIRAAGTLGGGAQNQPPQAVARVSTDQAAVGEPIQFDASQSTDPDGQIVSYLWNFGDGATSNQAVVSHAYAAAGTYTVSLMVTDNNGATSQASGQITITGGGGQVTRLTVNPASGTVAAGGASQITVTFDAQGLAEGPYTGSLALNTNGGAITLPVRILVTTRVDAEQEASLPSRVRLDQNFPNPFNPSTTIRYQLDAPASVLLHVFDVSGRRVKTLDTGRRPAGTFEVRWDGTDLEGRPVASGVYLYRLDLTHDDGRTTSETRKMILLK